MAMTYSPVSANRDVLHRFVNLNIVCVCELSCQELYVRSLNMLDIVRYF